MKVLPVCFEQYVGCGVPMWEEEIQRLNGFYKHLLWYFDTDDSLAFSKFPFFLRLLYELTFLIPLQPTPVGRLKHSLQAVLERKDSQYSPARIFPISSQ